MILLRGTAWRRRTLAKLVWLYVEPLVRHQTSYPIKVRTVARELDVDRPGVRASIRLLVAKGYLRCTVPPSRGREGEYCLGTRALARIHRPGTLTTPAMDDPQSLCPPLAA